MKTSLKKAVSLMLVFMMCLTIGVPAFATSIEPNRPNGIEFIKKDITDTSAYLQYYLTVDGKTAFITESAEVKNNTISADISSVEVDKNSNPIGSTQKDDHLTVPIAESSTNCSIKPQVELSSAGPWHPYSTTYSLSGAQFTAISVAILLAAASGMGLPAAVTAATAMLSVLAAYGESKIPDSVYFEGERCVSHSCGKIYYRYRGNLYLDDSKKVLLAENLSWSRRWGH